MSVFLGVKGTGMNMSSAVGGADTGADEGATGAFEVGSALGIAVDVAAVGLAVIVNALG